MKSSLCASVIASNSLRPGGGSTVGCCMLLRLSFQFVSFNAVLCHGDVCRVQIVKESIATKPISDDANGTRATEWVEHQAGDRRCVDVKACRCPASRPPF